MQTELILSFLRQNLPDLTAVYLFGSRARGTARPDSDLDLAVLVNVQLDPTLLWELAQKLSEQVGCEVDLIDLCQASTVLQYQIITTGQRIWAHGVGPGVYEAFILSEYTHLNEARAGLLSDIHQRGRVYGR